MPLVTTKDMFKKAYDGGYAIGAFNVNNMEIVQAITRAAKRLEAPVILQWSARTLEGGPLTLFERKGSYLPAQVN